MILGITGADLITSVGAGRAASFAAFCRGVSGNKPLQCFDQRRFRVTRAYEVPDREQTGQDVPGRATRWLCRCVRQVMREAEIESQDERVAFLIGTGLRELRSLELWWADGFPFHISELHFAGALQREINIGGPAFTVANACSASNFTLGLAADWINLGDVDAVVVAGCDSITESMLGLVDRVTLTPPQVLQPFDRNRRGVLMGEGAAAVVLEPLERAMARGKVPLALLRGVGMSCDAYHETTPHLDGIVASMVDAHRLAGVMPENIDLIMAHGTGTDRNDQIEALAIKQVFGAAAQRPFISGLKSMTGHTSGASGLIGVIVAMEAMRQSRIPPTIGLTEPMEEAQGLKIVTNICQEAQIRIAQVNAFGFGGVNAVAVLEKVAG